jgi:hypothetical protein
MRSRSVIAGLAVAAGSVAGALHFRNRAARRRERVELYFRDGSMVSLSAGQPGADRLLAHARELLAATR